MFNRLFRRAALACYLVQVNRSAKHYRYMSIDAVYVRERQMQSTWRSLITILAPLTLILLMSQSMTAESHATDGLQPRFGYATVLVNQAESAGATSEEVDELVALLNRALELNGEALMLTSPSDAQRRGVLLAQVDQILSSVEVKAVQAQAAAARRTYANNVLMYANGAIAALLGTVAYAYGVAFYRKRRTERSFAMSISPK